MVKEPKIFYPLTLSYNGWKLTVECTHKQQYFKNWVYEKKSSPGGTQVLDATCFPTVADGLDVAAQEFSTRQEKMLNGRAGDEYCAIVEGTPPV